MRLVASTPSSTGMRMSISTTSGRVSRARETASSPSPASPTTAMSSSLSSSTRSPARSSAWSSTSSDPDHDWTPTGSESADAEASGGAGSRVELASESQRSLAHAVEAMAGAGLPLAVARLGATSVVDDLEDEPVGLVAHRHDGGRRSRVAKSVGEGLLCDAVGGTVDGGRQAASPAGHDDACRKAGGGSG